MRHIRRRGYSEEEAKDLTQELFQRLLERQFLCGLLREGGRFRSFLLTALDRFLVEHWQRSRAQKRGGGQPIVSIDAQTAEERYRLEPRDERTPETIYEYRWAMALLDQVLGRLQQEFSEAGKDEVFNTLRNYMVEGATEMSYAGRRPAAGHERSSAAQSGRACASALPGAFPAGNRPHGHQPGGSGR